MARKNSRMLWQSVGALVFSMALGFMAIQSSVKNHSPHSRNTGIRMPQSSVNEIYNLLAKVEKDLEDPNVFNRNTAVSYIKNLTEGAYNLTTKEIFPETEAEKIQFAETRSDWIDRLFRIQLLLRSKMMEFHGSTPLSNDLIAAFRNGNMYLSYAQDFVLMEWSQSHDLSTKKRMFEADFPVTTKNPQFKYFELAPGDVILVRGDSFISATIARSGDFLTNFSHVAMVVQDPNGKLLVAEALMEKNLITYDIEQYLSLEKLSRATVLRPKNLAAAKVAAQTGFKIIDDDFKAPVKKVFDMLMNPEQHDKIYCFELVKMAYRTANINLPTFPMSFKKALAGNSFYRNMGNQLEVGAAPDDVFFQPEFDVVMVQRDVSKIKSDWAFDVAMSTTFEFIENRYDYKQHLSNEAIAKIALFIKDELKIKLSGVPSGVPAQVVALILEHKAIATSLQALLMKEMNASKRILAYKELESIARVWLEQNKDNFFVPCTTPKGGKGKACSVVVGGKSQ